MRNEYDFTEGKRGAVVPATAGKSRITIMLDEVLKEELAALRTLTA